MPTAQHWVSSRGNDYIVYDMERTPTSPRHIYRLPLEGVASRGMLLNLNDPDAMDAMWYMANHPELEPPPDPVTRKNVWTDVYQELTVAVQAEFGLTTARNAVMRNWAASRRARVPTVAQINARRALGLNRMGGPDRAPQAIHDLLTPLLPRVDEYRGRFVEALTRRDETVPR